VFDARSFGERRSRPERITSNKRDRERAKANASSRERDRLESRSSDADRVSPSPSMTAPVCRDATPMQVASRRVRCGTIVFDADEPQRPPCTIASPAACTNPTNRPAVAATPGKDVAPLTVDETLRRTLIARIARWQGAQQFFGKTLKPISRCELGHRCQTQRTARCLHPLQRRTPESTPPSVVEPRREGEPRSAEARLSRADEPRRAQRPEGSIRGPRVIRGAACGEGGGPR
jgi:hypothetical protein